MKHAWLTFSAVAGFLALNLGATSVDVLFRPTIEAVAQRIGLAPDEWASPILDLLLSLLASEWLRNAAFFIMGAAAWEIWRRRERTQRSWRDPYRALDKLKVFEAACLAADIPPSVKSTNAHARGIMTQLYVGMREGAIPYVANSPRRRWVAYSSIWGEPPAAPPPTKPEIGPFTSVDRAGVSRYLRAKGLRREAENLGPI